ncbi:MAG: hypothetical protein PHD54_11720 [Desulfuromonadaceae bacterium]|nr:hypothetical protein [Desulfuromonadaceae bacterium]
MQRWLKIMIIALSITIPFTGSSTAEEAATKSKFMGIFKGSYQSTYPQAVVVKRFLINNAVFTVNSKTIADAQTIQSMSEKLMTEFISKGSESCKAQQYYVIEEVAVQLNYHPDGSHLLHADANVVCFNMIKSQ